jgi:hypothetical protein
MTMIHQEKNDDSINALRRGLILVIGLKAEIFALGLLAALREMRSPAVLCRDRHGSYPSEHTDDVAVIRPVPLDWTVAVQVSREGDADVVVHSNDGWVGFITKGARSGTVVDLNWLRRQLAQGDDRR